MCARARARVCVCVCDISSKPQHTRLQSNLCGNNESTDYACDLYMYVHSKQLLQYINVTHLILHVGMCVYVVHVCVCVCVCVCACCVFVCVVLSPVEGIECLYHANYM